MPEKPSTRRYCSGYESRVLKSGVRASGDSFPRATSSRRSSSGILASVFEARFIPVPELVEEEPLCLLRPAREQEAEGIWIGAEHPHPALLHCAVVRATYRAGDGSEGQVALLGPMRMAYATALSAVRSVASSLQRLLS